MTDMNKDKKRLILFDMQEHPERYTDEQVADLLADKDMKDFLRDLAMARMAVKKANPQKVDVDEAWKEFTKTHRKTKSIDADETNIHYRNRMKIAASIAGIIFLSSITLAAVRNGWFKFSVSNKAVENKITTEQVVPAKVFTTDSNESLDMKPVVFDNAKLETILAQMAEFYHVKVEYTNAQTMRIRLFFNWDKTKTLEQNLEILNAFDRIQIEYASGTLKVK